MGHLLKCLFLRLVCGQSLCGFAFQVKEYPPDGFVCVCVRMSALQWYFSHIHPSEPKDFTPRCLCHVALLSPHCPLQPCVQFLYFWGGLVFRIVLGFFCLLVLVSVGLRCFNNSPSCCQVKDRFRLWWTLKFYSILFCKQLLILQNNWLQKHF